MSNYYLATHARKSQDAAETYWTGNLNKYGEPMVSVLQSKAMVFKDAAEAYFVGGMHQSLHNFRAVRPLFLINGGSDGFKYRWWIKRRK